MESKRYKMLKDDEFDFSDPKNLIIQFPSKELAKHFMTWLCEIGEQSYFDEGLVYDRPGCNDMHYDWENNIITAKKVEEE